jgi:hypothetical protein
MEHDRRPDRPFYQPPWLRMLCSRSRLLECSEMTHPFIDAVQSALDTHGLPDDVDMFTIGHSTMRPSGVHAAIWLRCGAESQSQNTLVQAMAVAEHERRRRADLVTRVAERAVARKLLADAGIDPDLVTA